MVCFVQDVRLSAVVFDLFHTLVDPEDFRPKGFRRADSIAALLGADRSEFASYWNKTTTERSSTERPSIDYIREFQEAAGKPASTRTLTEAVELIGRYQDLAVLNPREEVLTCLQLLKSKGPKIGLLSNAEEPEVRNWFRSPLATYFDFVAFSYKTGKLKPDAASYGSVLEGLRADPTSCAYVGDGGNQELLGAKAAGFNKVVFMSRFVSRNGIRTADELKTLETQSDLTVDDFLHLPSDLGF